MNFLFLKNCIFLIPLHNGDLSYIENYTLLRFKDDKKLTERILILYYNINEFIQDRTQVPQYSKTTMLKNRITIKPQYSKSASSRNLRLLERLLPFPFF